MEIQFAPIIRGESLYFNEFLRQLSRAFLEIYEGIRLQTINAADYYAIFSVRHPEAEIAFSSQPRMLTEENGLFTMEPNIKIRIHFWLPPPQTIFFTKGIDSMCSHNKLNAVELTQYTQLG